MNDTAFAIMQIGSADSAERRRADEVLEYILAPVLSDDEFKLDIIRADLVVTPGSISPKMLNDLISARVVIADLTGRNPNVFYELGIAHAFEKAVISLGQPSGLPFDVQDERVISLPGPQEKLGVREADTARAQLRESLRVVLQDDYTPTSPLTSVASRRALDDLAPDNPIAAEIAALREKVDDVRENITSELRKIYQEVDLRRVEERRDQTWRRMIQDGTIAQQMAELVTSNPEVMEQIFSAQTGINPKDIFARMQDLQKLIGQKKLPDQPAEPESSA